MNIIDSSCWIEYFMNSEIGAIVAGVIENPGELHFDLSRKIFDDRIAFKKLFIERFAIEGAGGIFNERGITNNA